MALAGRASRDAGENVCIYRKVSDEGTCPKCEVRAHSVGADEFLSCEGKILEANCLDVISYEVADEDRRVEWRVDPPLPRAT